MTQNNIHITRNCKFMDSCPFCDTKDCPDTALGCFKLQQNNKEKADSLERR